MPHHPFGIVIYMKKWNTGFTLVEMLIVIGLIALVATITVSGFGNLQQGARDGRRKEDIDKVNTAIQAYRNDTGKFPTAVNYGELMSILTPDYISVPPVDPLNRDGFVYTYFSADGSRYELGARLEARGGDGNNKFYYADQNGGLELSGTPVPPTATGTPSGNAPFLSPTAYQTVAP